MRTKRPLHIGTDTIERCAFAQLLDGLHQKEVVTVAILCVLCRQVVFFIDQLQFPLRMFWLPSAHEEVPFSVMSFTL